MQTLAVLAALAAVAVAVPALPGYGYDRYRPVQYRLPASYRREKKSPPLVTDFAPTELARGDIDATPEVSARTFKKPIIIKKKYGYHLYRDSDEEQAQADSQEKCTKEVKVKLCDAENLAKSGDFMRAAEDTSAQNNENDMKHSIKMAKEAVENLQKMTQFQNAELGPDAELHGDIEVARQALEHIQKNFGNLEAMNLPATTLNNAEALHAARSAIAKTDNEKMAQWKEAIENIQKNAEIAKNIEDSFKSASTSNVPLSSETEAIKKMKNSEVAEETTKNFTNAKSDAEKATEHETLTTINTEEENDQIIIPAVLEHKHSDDLVNKAKEAMKTEDHIIETKNVEKPLISEALKIGKSSESDLHALEPVNHLDGLAKPLDGHVSSLPAFATPMKEKSAEHKENSAALETKNNDIVKAERPKESENMDVTLDMETAPSAPVEIKVMGPFSAKEVKEEQAHLSTLNQDSADHHLIEEKSSKKEITNMKMIAKSSEIVPVANEKKIDTSFKVESGKAVDFDTTSLMTNAELIEKHEQLRKESLQSPALKDDHTGKSAEPKEFTNDHAVPVVRAHLSEMKSANMHLQQNEQKPLNQFHMRPTKENNSEMRASEPKPMQQLHDRPTFQAQGKNWHVDSMAPKASRFPDSTRNSASAVAQSSSAAVAQNQLKPHHHHMGQHEPHFDQHNRGPNFQQNGQPWKQGHHSFHGKSADDAMGQATSQVNVNDVTGKAVMEHNNMQWNKKEAARGAYGGYGAGVGALGLGGAGSGAGSGPGAVGVFPGANVGGCAIPLLLSCSPSVVSGSLAKGPAYAGHAYRAGENLENRFHAKRDTKTNKDMPTKVKRAPAKKALQNIHLDKKQ